MTARRPVLIRNGAGLFPGVSQDTWAHDYPITFDVASELRLPVRSDMPDEVMQLMGLHAQPVRRRVSVEYPSKRRRRQAAEPKKPRGT